MISWSPHSLKIFLDHLENAFYNDAYATERQRQGDCHEPKERDADFCSSRDNNDGIRRDARSRLV